MATYEFNRIGREGSWSDNEIGVLQKDYLIDKYDISSNIYFNPQKYLLQIETKHEHDDNITNIIKTILDELNYAYKIESIEKDAETRIGIPVTRHNIRTGEIIGIYWYRRQSKKYQLMKQGQEEEQ